MKPHLTLGPIQFHWPADQWRDFYFRMADEAPVDRVYIGEVVCSKRAPFYEPLYQEVMEYLQRAGKEVIFSTLAEVMIHHDCKMVKSMAEIEEVMVEANDASALFYLAGRPHAIGPFMNLYNEESLSFLAERGARHMCLPAELPRESVAVLAQKSAALNVTTEVQIYGRVPLALSARCYHARAHGRIKDNCQFVCEEDADGLPLKTLDGQSFLVINGIETMSHTCINMVQELDDLRGLGVSHFRISPHSHDMVSVAKLYRAVLDGSLSPTEATEALTALRPDMPFSNGFYHKRSGHEWIKAAA